MKPFWIIAALVITCIVIDPASSAELRITRVEPRIDAKSDEEVASQVFLSDGSKLIVPLIHVKGIEVLKAPNGTPYILLSGTKCTECDMNDSIYLVSHKVKGSGIALPGYPYPGSFKAYYADELVEKTRMFYGRCLPEEKDVVLWFSEYLGTDRTWHKLNSVLRLENKGSVLSELKGPGGNMKDVLRRTKSGACKELPGIDGHTEP